MTDWAATGERKTVCPCGIESYRPEPVMGRRQALRCIGCHHIVGRCTCLLPKQHGIDWREVHRFGGLGRWLAHFRRDGR